MPMRTEMPYVPVQEQHRWQENNDLILGIVPGQLSGQYWKK